MITYKIARLGLIISTITIVLFVLSCKKDDPITPKQRTEEDSIKTFLTGSNGSKIWKYKQAYIGDSSGRFVLDSTGQRIAYFRTKVSVDSAFISCYTEKKYLKFSNDSVLFNDAHIEERIVVTDSVPTIKFHYTYLCIEGSKTEKLIFQDSIVNRKIYPTGLPCFINPYDCPIYAQYYYTCTISKSELYVVYKSQYSNKIGDSYIEVYK